MTKKSTRENSKPRIILLMQFYDPEPVYKGQEFAEAIAKSGYEVEVVTGFPNFPGGKIYSGYRIWPIKKSTKNGIMITRLALFPSHSKNKLGRVLNYSSFMLSAFLYLTFMARRANLVYAYHPPLTVGLAATAARVFRRHPVVVDIHDLWPDTLPATGMLQDQRILKLVEIMCNWMYRRVQHIILHTNGFRDQLLKRGVPAEKMTTVIGWTHESKDKVTKFEAPKPMKSLNGLKVLYAGNVGPAQALGTVLDAAQILQTAGHRKMATFCILGEGIELGALKEKAKSLSLSNVVFLPRVPQAAVQAYLAEADILLIHLRDTPLFSLNIPSKAQAYMLAAKPIIIGMRGEVERLFSDTQAGICVQPENPEQMANAILSLAAMSASDREKLGENAYNYYWSELCMAKGMKKFMTIFDKVRCQ